MPRLIAALIRHGDYHQLQDTPSAWQPFGLNDAGEKHALDAAHTINTILQQQQWCLHPLCHASQLLRAWQTATIICQQLSSELSNSQHNFQYNKQDNKQSLQVQSFDGLAERSVGSLANLSNQKIAAIVAADPRYPELPANWKSDSLFSLPVQGAESLMQAGERVALHINHSMLELKKQAQHDTLKLFVGHGAAFRHAAHKLGVLEFNKIAKLSMYHGSAIFLELSAQGQWTHILGDWKVRPAKTSYTD